MSDLPIVMHYIAMAILLIWVGVIATKQRKIIELQEEIVDLLKAMYTKHKDKINNNRTMWD